VVFKNGISSEVFLIMHHGVGPHADTDQKSWGGGGLNGTYALYVIFTRSTGKNNTFSCETVEVKIPIQLKVIRRE
jgi:hypothetical protein